MASDRQPPAAQGTRDEDLMAAYVAGDTSALRTLFEHHGPMLVRLGGRKGLSEADARDLAQQTFLQVHLARFDYTVGRPLRPWLTTIAMNLVRDVYRRRAARPTEPMEDRDWADPGDDPSMAAERRQEAQRVRAAVGKLPAIYRETIELHWFEGLSFSEVADVVGASLSAVKVRAHRGYKDLQALLAEGDRPPAPRKST